MYLHAWSPTLWPTVMPTVAEIYAGQTPAEREEGEKRWGEQHNTLMDGFHKTLTDVRRLLANVPSLMQFDDHEITDDWYRNLHWLIKSQDPATPAGKFGRTVVRNGLAAFVVFQLWGNTPERFVSTAASTAGAEILQRLGVWHQDRGAADTTTKKTLQELEQFLGLPEPATFVSTGAPAGPVTHATRIDYHFSHEWQNHQVLFLDTRTMRVTPPGKDANHPPMLISGAAAYTKQFAGTRKPGPGRAGRRRLAGSGLRCRAARASRPHRPEPGGGRPRALAAERGGPAGAARPARRPDRSRRHRRAPVTNRDPVGGRALRVDGGRAVPGRSADHPDSSTRRRCHRPAHVERVQEPGRAHEGDLATGATAPTSTPATGPRRAQRRQDLRLGEPERWSAPGPVRCGAVDREGVARLGAAIIAPAREPDSCRWCRLQRRSGSSTSTRPSTRRLTGTGRRARRRPAPAMAPRRRASSTTPSRRCATSPTSSATARSSATTTSATSRSDGVSATPSRSSTGSGSGSPTRTSPSSPTPSTSSTCASASRPPPPVRTSASVTTTATPAASPGTTGPTASSRCPAAAWCGSSRTSCASSASCWWAPPTAPSPSRPRRRCASSRSTPPWAAPPACPAT